MMFLREQTKRKVELQLEILRLAAAGQDLRTWLDERSIPVGQNLLEALDALDRVRVEMGFGEVVDDEEPAHEPA